MGRVWRGTRTLAWGMGALFGLVFLVSMVAWGAAPLNPPGLPRPDLVGGSVKLGDVSAIKAMNMPRVSPLLNQAYLVAAGGRFQSVQTMGIVGLEDGLAEIVVDCVPGRIEDIEALVSDCGGRVASTYQGLLFARFPLARLPELAAANGVIRVRTPFRARPLVVNEGNAVQCVKPFHQMGSSGQGVKVGVLDCGGFAGYRGLLGTDLPAEVTVWQGSHAPNHVGTDPVHEIHGQACAEIVHDMAPGADLYLAYDYTEEDYYRGVDWLIDQGVEIISYSCGWTGAWPYDGGGLPYNPVDQKASDARTQNGVLFVTSAGNEAYHGMYHGWFHPCGTDPGRQYFGNDGNFDWCTDPIIFYQDPARPQPLYITLSWNDWPGDPSTQGSTQDYDMYLWDFSTGAAVIIARSENRQDGSPGALPFEEIAYLPAAGWSPWYYITVRKHHATGKHFLDLRTPNGYLYLYNQDMTLSTPADSPNVVTVGAVFWNDLQLEPFSSQGPTFGAGGSEKGGYLKPNLAAADGVSTATYGPSDGLPWMSYGTGFFGTSASCPQVAGAAAVLRSAYPYLDAAGLERQLGASTVDMGDVGPDNVTGYGRLCLQQIAADTKEVPALSRESLVLLGLLLAAMALAVIRRKKGRA